jgi:hypothetical protein
LSVLKILEDKLAYLLGKKRMLNGEKKWKEKI